MRRGAAALSILSIIAPFLSAAAPQWQAGTGFYHASGDYGTESDTSVTYIPISFGRLFPKGRLDLVMPFIRVTSSDDVTVVGGKVQRVERGSGAAETSADGLGDILLRGRLDVLSENDGRFVPDMTLLAKIKFPTADEDKGLGTGEFDESIGAEFWKTIEGPWSALWEIGYTWTGNPPDQELRNVWSLGLGAGYAFRDNVVGTAAYEESRAVVSGSENPRDLVFGISYLPKPELQLGGNLQFGLSDGAADMGLGIQGSLKF